MDYGIDILGDGGDFYPCFSLCFLDDRLEEGSLSAALLVRLFFCKELALEDLSSGIFH